MANLLRISDFSKMPRFTTLALIFASAMIFTMFTTRISDAASPAPMVINDAVSCGVCGMFPAKFPKWQAQIIFSDGDMVAFDGCKDMFKYVLDMTAYDQKHTGAQIAAVWVKDFNSGQWLDGRAAIFVFGSKVMGPMGQELIPFADSASADSFRAENEGMISSYDAVTMDEVKKLGMGGMKKPGMMKGRM